MVDTPDDTPRTAASHQDDGALPGRLRALRLAHQLTQRALAHRAGVPLSTIGQLERGQRRRITLTLVQALARGLEVEVEALLGMTRPEDLDTLVRHLDRALSPQARAAMAALRAGMAVLDALSSGGYAATGDAPS